MEADVALTPVTANLVMTVYAPVIEIYITPDTATVSITTYAPFVGTTIRMITTADLVLEAFVATIIIVPIALAILEGCVTLPLLINKDKWPSNVEPSGYVEEVEETEPSGFIKAPESHTPSGYIRTSGNNPWNLE